MGCFCVGMVDQVKKKAQGRHPQEQDAEQQPEQKAFSGIHPIPYLLDKRITTDAHAFLQTRRMVIGFQRWPVGP